MAYNPKQPRAPKGTTIGGQWVDDEEVWARRAAVSAKHELAERRMAGFETDYQTIDLMNEDGRWPKEREELHQRIEDALMSGKTPVQNPETYVLGGGPASGKSTVLHSGLADIPGNTVYVDTDYIKTLLPEYNQELAAGNPFASRVVHEESSYLAKKISNRAVEGSYNIVKDGTGDNSIESLSASTLALGRGSRPINGIYVTIPIETAIFRAGERAKIDGRRVPTENIIGTHVGVSKVFQEAISKDIFDTLKLFDNSGPVPVLIGEKRAGGTWRVLDEAAYQAFLAKVYYGN